MDVDDGATKNLADQVQRVAKMQASKAIIRSVIFGSDRASDSKPRSNHIGITLFSEDQIADIKRFCVTGKTPLSFDKTFNLGELFVTPSAYKNLAIQNNKGEHPIMLGPVFIHNRSTFEACNPFFSSLSASLRKVDTSNLVIGTDDETAPRQAIEFNFFCMNE
jgi:hypothetical protein